MNMISEIIQNRLNETINKSTSIKTTLNTQFDLGDGFFGIFGTKCGVVIIHNKSIHQDYVTVSIYNDGFSWQVTTNDYLMKASWIEDQIAVLQKAHQFTQVLL